MYKFNLESAELRRIDSTRLATPKSTQVDLLGSTPRSGYIGCVAAMQSPPASSDQLSASRCVLTPDSGNADDDDDAELVTDSNQ